MKQKEDDKKVEERLNFIEQAIHDYKVGKLSPFAALTAIGIIVCPGKISEDQRKWAIDALSKV